MKKKIMKSHKHAGPTDKEFNMLGELWAKYGAEEIISFLFFLEREELLAACKMARPYIGHPDSAEGQQLRSAINHAEGKGA